MNKKIKLILSEFGLKHFSAHIIKKEQNLKDQIMKETSFLKEDVSFSERVYCILNNIKSKKICECGAALKFKSMKVGYSKYCSVLCARRSEKAKEEIRKTCLEKYGAVSYVSSKIGKEAIKETNLRR